MNAFSGFVGPFPIHSMDTTVCDPQPASAVWKQVPYPKGTEKHLPQVTSMVRLHDLGDVSVEYMSYRSGDRVGYHRGELKIQ